jgi:hypothetical protein
MLAVVLPMLLLLPFAGDALAGSRIRVAARIAHGG